MGENKEETDRYLLSYHRDALMEILADPNVNKHYSISINFLELFENDPNLGNNLLKNPESSLQNWDCAILRTQNVLLNEERSHTVKIQVHCRIHGLPVCPELHRTIFPKNGDVNKFLQIHGTVTRIANTKMLEYQREFICAKCKLPMIIKADYEYRNVITPPKKCSDCGHFTLVSGELNPEYCKDYQEVKMQENVSKLDVGSIPSWIWVTLEDDLVDSCKPGDHVTVCGVVKRRWDSLSLGKKMRIELAVRANHIQVNNSNNPSHSVTSESKAMFDGLWKTYAKRQLVARDIILKSICPQLFGMHMVKLAVAVVLAGGSQNVSNDMKIRSEPHLLLIGDPGTGKSQMLRFASKIIPRSVLTTGVGSTAAGLTATAVMEDGQWQLEGGALVLSDGGICCIDEFNSMKEHDRISIHEAMEQQTISVAKASIVCTLSTKCSIVAATNPKGNIDPSQPLSINIALPSPLMSRFDLVLLIRDKVDANRDSLIADYIMAPKCSKLELHWSTEMLQSYFIIIKKNNPILTEEANKILSAYYQAQRRNRNRNKSRTTVRLLDSLVRLSQGHAKLMYHRDVEVVDVIFAIALIETSMDREFSLFDLSFDVQSDFPDCPMKSYSELVRVILTKLNLQDILRKELENIDKNEAVENNSEGSSGDGRPNDGLRCSQIGSDKPRTEALNPGRRQLKREESLVSQVDALKLEKSKGSQRKQDDSSSSEGNRPSNNGVGFEENKEELDFILPDNEISVSDFKQKNEQNASNFRKTQEQTTSKRNDLDLELNLSKTNKAKSCDQKSKRFKFNPKRSQVVNDACPLNDAIFDTPNFDDDNEIFSGIQPNFESTRIDFVDDRVGTNDQAGSSIPKQFKKITGVAKDSRKSAASIANISRIDTRADSAKCDLEDSEKMDVLEDSGRDAKRSRSSEGSSLDEKREKRKKRLSKFRFVPKEPEQLKEPEPLKEPEAPKEQPRKDNSNSTLFESQLDDADFEI